MTCGAASTVRDAPGALAPLLSRVLLEVLEPTLSELRVEIASALRGGGEPCADMAQTRTTEAPMPSPSGTGQQRKGAAPSPSAPIHPTNARAEGSDSPKRAGRPEGLAMHTVGAGLKSAPPSRLPPRVRAWAGLEPAGEAALPAGAGGPRCVQVRVRRSALEEGAARLSTALMMHGALFDVCRSAMAPLLPHESSASPGSHPCATPPPLQTGEALQGEDRTAAGGVPLSVCASVLADVLLTPSLVGKSPTAPPASSRDARAQSGTAVGPSLPSATEEELYTMLVPPLVCALAVGACGLLAGLLGLSTVTEGGWGTPAGVLRGVGDAAFEEVARGLRGGQAGVEDRSGAHSPTRSSPRTASPTAAHGRRTPRDGSAGTISPVSPALADVPADWTATVTFAPPDPHTVGPCASATPALPSLDKGVRGGQRDVRSRRAPARSRGTPTGARPGPRIVIEGVAEGEPPAWAVLMVRQVCGEVCTLAERVAPEVAGGPAPDTASCAVSLDGPGLVEWKDAPPPLSASTTPALVSSGSSAVAAVAGLQLVRWLPLPGPSHPPDPPVESFARDVLARGGATRAVSDAATVAVLEEVGTVLSAVDRVFTARTIVDASAWRYGRNRVTLAVESTVYVEGGGVEEGEGVTVMDSSHTDPCTGGSDESPVPSQVAAAGSGARSRAARTPKRKRQRRPCPVWRPVARYIHETGVLYNTAGQAFALDVEAEERW